MPHDSPLDYSLSALATALRDGEFHPAELIPEVDARLVPQHPCFATIDLDYSYDTARTLCPATPGQYLYGIPMPIKDLSPVADMPCAYGSVHRLEIPRRTDPYIASLIQQGIVVTGKTQTSEMGMTAYTEPIGFAPVDNPLLPGRTPGGSSGGAAVAVAMGFMPAAHGSDGGGSIRVPAAATGLVGFKPAHVSTGGKLTVQGFITRTVEDAAFLHNVRPKHRELRIGVLTTPLHGDGIVDPVWAQAALSAADTLADCGHHVIPVTPYGPEVFEAFQQTICILSQRIHGPASPIIEWMRSQPIDRGAAMWKFHQVPGIVQRWGIDVLLTPTLSYDPPSIGTFSRLDPASDFAAQTEWTPWASLFNITGGAAISVPYAGKSVHLGAINATPAELLFAAKELHR